MRPFLVYSRMPPLGEPAHECFYCQSPKETWTRAANSKNVLHRIIAVTKSEGPLHEQSALGHLHGVSRELQHHRTYAMKHKDLDAVNESDLLTEVEKKILLERTR